MGCLVSVIVPVFRVENYIRRCVDSVLNQSFVDFELILIDDGSPDNCGKICDEYAEKESRIHVIHKENGGLSDARNAGIEWAFKNSDSEWITFIDSDDWIHPRYLESLYNAVVETVCEISVCRYKETAGKEPEINESKLITQIVNTECFFCEHRVNAVVAWGKLYKKDLFNDIRYPVGKLHEDEFTTYKLLFQYPNIAFINQPLYYYFRNENSITQSEWNPKRLDAISAYQEQENFFHEKGLFNAYRKTINSHANCLVRYIQEIYMFPEFKYHKKMCKRELRHIIKKHKDIFSIKQTPLLFQYAYPMKMNMYWLFDSQRKKLKKEKRNWLV